MKHSIGFILLIVTALSCQMPTQPIVKVTNERVVVNIRESTNKPVPGIDIIMSNDTTNEAYTGRTNEAGNWEETVNVPTSGRAYKLRIGDPINIRNPFGVTYDSIFLRCSDTTIFKRIHRIRLLQCSGVSSVDTASLHICFDSTLITDTAESPWITTNGCSMNMTWSLNPPPGVTLKFAKKSGVTWTTLASLPTQLQASDTLVITAVYAPTLGSDRSDRGDVTATIATVPPSTYSFNLEAVTHAHCSECQCPGADWTPIFNDGKQPVKVCAGRDSILSFAVAGIQNTSKDPNCQYLFSLESDFPDALELQSSLSQSILTGGEKMGSITVHFSPLTAPKNFDETAVYKISIRSSDGSISACQQKLKLHVQVQSVGPQCDINAVDLLNGETFNGKKYNLSQCVDQTDHDTKIYLKNIGDCPLLTPINISFAGANSALFTASPSTVSFLAPHDSVPIKLMFSPKSTDVWPSRNTCDPPTTDFPVTLNVQNCNPTTFNLIAYANPNCHRDITMGVSDSAKSKVGLEIDTSNDAVTTSDSLHINSWSMFFRSISPTGGGNGTADLQSSGGAKGYYCYFTDPSQCAYSAGEQICDNPKCCYVNNNACSFPNTQPEITIQAHHFYLFHYYHLGLSGGSAERCGLIHVDDIIHDGTSNKDFVNIEFCFPIQ